ncbi:MerR family transcriptional regulator [Gordonia sp. HS-NH1]|uniref:MerR family transcriptional regulator n=1 Tax=Gordonia sp. HS-NH1 TaxID=1435068 RepID=UPI0006E3DB70|nr:MerR family transcriptional regulator [Gordonia sp. HS-NH1]
MRIGEVQRLTGVSARSLRHYDAHGLLATARNSNGYRDFGEGTVEQVGRIKRLLAAGFSIDTIRHVLPCVNGDQVEMCPKVAALIRDELLDIDNAMADLTRKRDLVTSMITEQRLAK